MLATVIHLQFNDAGILYPDILDKDTISNAMQDTPVIVAEVAIEKEVPLVQQLDEVYRLTNTIDKPWCDNTGVHPCSYNPLLKSGVSVMDGVYSYGVIKNYRSTSVGDVIIRCEPDEQYGTNPCKEGYLVDDVGYTKLTREQLAKIVPKWYTCHKFIRTSFYHWTLQ
tara:strand:- start:1550 stop:2050 length:501 start_codon:yes stop_codon:yes gene_type:complete